MIKEYTMPCIHMNGSDEDSLRRQYNNLFCAVSDAQIKLLYDTDFHERDYYPLGGEAWDKAYQEREEIKEAMTKVYQYAKQHMHFLDYGKEPLPDED
jgi:hypothetical protein